MPRRVVSVSNDQIYHVFNRGVEKRDIFKQPRDYQRFLQTVYYYQYLGPKPKFSVLSKINFEKFNPSTDSMLVDIYAYCLMPNHFHFLLKQIKDNGVAIFISQFINSYTRYFNTKYSRIGHLFQGSYKVVLVEDEEQFLHLSRYIHLNPRIASPTQDLDSYKWSSWNQYTLGKAGLCNTKEILGMITVENYKDFVHEQIEYAESLHKLKHKLIDIE